jgi:hypothetical protein
MEDLLPGTDSNDQFRAALSLAWTEEHNAKLVYISGEIALIVVRFFIYSAKFPSS